MIEENETFGEEYSFHIPSIAYCCLAVFVRSAVNDKERGGKTKRKEKK